MLGGMERGRERGKGEGEKGRGRGARRERGEGEGLRGKKGEGRRREGEKGRGGRVPADLDLSADVDCMLGRRAGRLEEWSGMGIVERGKWGLGEGEAGRRGRLMGSDILDEQMHLEAW